MVLSWESLKEACLSLRPFYEAPVELIKGIITRVVATSKKQFWESYHAINEWTIIVWAIKYFDLPYYFHKAAEFPENLKLLELFIPIDRNIHLEFTTGRMIEWESFREWPTISMEYFNGNSFSQDEIGIKPRHPHPSKGKVAMVFGPLHVYTFDEYLYDAAEYSSDCMFLLAHDLRKSSFTVLSTKKAIHILYPEITVSVNSENEIFINGSQVPSIPPIISSNGKVVVTRSDVIEISSPSLKVICSCKDFLCVLELNAWYDGETFGLLGNADGLKSNDFILPEGKITSDTLEFVGNYEVSGKPECKNLRLISKPPSSSDGEEFCSNQIKELCSQSKDIQKSFMDMCKSDYQTDNDTCYASSGYAALCYFKKLSGKPTDCNRKEQESERIEPKLEVVFIAHEHKSLISTQEKTDLYESIERLLTAVEEKLKENGYSSILFSLVSFGRKGAHHFPTVHAKGRDTWVPLQTLVKDMLTNLTFDGDEEVYVLDVLKYVSDVLGHDTFNSKIFIILTPKDQQSESKHILDVTKHSLEKNGIILYTISSYPSADMFLREICGVRNDGLLLPSNESSPAFLDYFKGDLARLSFSTRGTVFLSKFLLSKSSTSFISEFSEEVLKEVRRESFSCRKCRAVKSGWWWQVNECNLQLHCFQPLMVYVTEILNN